VAAAAVAAAPDTPMRAAVKALPGISIEPMPRHSCCCCCCDTCWPCLVYIVLPAAAPGSGNGPGRLTVWVLAVGPCKLDWAYAVRLKGKPALVPGTAPTG
jgi:hypothetical protein